MRQTLSRHSVKHILFYFVLFFCMCEHSKSLWSPQGKLHCHNIVKSVVHGFKLLQIHTNLRRFNPQSRVLSYSSLQAYENYLHFLSRASSFVLFRLFGLLLLFEGFQLLSKINLRKDHDF